MKRFLTLICLVTLMSVGCSGKTDKVVKHEGEVPKSEALDDKSAKAAAPVAPGLVD